MPVPGAPAGTMYSPRVSTALEFNNSRSNFMFPSVVDSGADYCTFPAVFGERLGINIQNGIKMATAGLGGGDDLYFHNIKVLVVIENQAWSFDCFAGFSRSMDNLGLGLLGRHGFFELFEEVIFEQKNRVFKLKVSGERPKPPIPPPPSQNPRL